MYVQKWLMATLMLYIFNHDLRKSSPLQQSWGAAGIWSCEFLPQLEPDGNFWAVLEGVPSPGWHMRDLVLTFLA
jgi:hypothetical protein